MSSMPDVLTTEVAVRDAAETDMPAIQAIYAHAARYPKDLRAAGYPVGPHNDDWIHTTTQATHRGGGHVVCAWGRHARGLPRADEVIRIVRSCGIDPLVLDRCACGTPAHPLLLRYSCRLQPL